MRVPLDIYIDSPVEAIYTLLDKVHIDQISNFTNMFLKQYIFNNNLQNDTVFGTYIQVCIIFLFSFTYEDKDICCSCILNFFLINNYINIIFNIILENYKKFV